MTDIEKAMKEAHKFADKALEQSNSKLQVLWSNVLSFMRQPVVTTRAYVTIVVVLCLVLGVWLG
jgi:hypothetical protein